MDRWHGNRRLTPTQEESVISDYRDGRSLAEIAAHIGYTKEGIRKVLQRWQVPLRRRGRQSAA